MSNDPGLTHSVGDDCPGGHGDVEEVLMPNNTAKEAMCDVLGRTQRALEGLDRLFDGPVTYDAQRIAEMMERFTNASPGPYLAVRESNAFDNWPVIFSGGADQDGVKWAVTTDRIHASEMVSGGAREDIEFAAHAWADLRYLVKLVQQQQWELWQLRAKGKEVPDAS